MQLDIINQKKPALRDCQNQLISDIRTAISQGHRRILVQLWVGGGKTFTAAEIMRLMSEKRRRSLFVAPRRQLVYQTMNSLNRFDVNCGCIMAGESRFTQPLAQVGSIDTLVSRISSERMIAPDAELVFVDEAHVMSSKKRLEFLDNYKIVVGLTSTPALANGKGMGSFYTKLVEGPSMKQMVDDGLLVPMRYFCADAPDLEKVRLNKDGDYAENQLADASDKPELIGSIYKNYKRIAGDRTTLIFAVNRKHAQHIHDEFLAHGVKSEYLDGNTLTEEREAMERRVASGETKVIVNIGVMAFGTDWPRISCVIVARVTKNICAWIQMVGRGSRLFPGKDDCLVIYHGDNFEELGMLDDPIEWSLDDKTTVKERKQKEKEAKKEPKEITCGDCGTVFKSRRDCPSCGHESIPLGQPIPVHEAELKEITVSATDKKEWYAQLLYISNSKGYKRGWADYKFKEKFSHFPAKKNGITPIPPGPEVLNYIKYLNIRNAKMKTA